MRKTTTYLLLVCIMSVFSISGWAEILVGRGLKTRHPITGERVLCSTDSLIINDDLVIKGHDIYSSDSTVINILDDLYVAGNVTGGGVGFNPAQTVIVAKSGGDFTSIQAAIDSITDSSATKPYVILVYPGVYEELVNVNKSYVAIVGVNRYTCIIKKNINTDHYAVLRFTASNSSIANMTIHNTATSGWAMAVRVEGNVDGTIIRNCDLLGLQDTVYVYGVGTTNKTEIYNCYIYGKNDIVSVDSNAKLVNCDLKTNHPNYGGSCFFIHGNVESYNCRFYEATTDAGYSAIVRFASNDASLLLVNAWCDDIKAVNPIRLGNLTPTVKIFASRGDQFPASAVAQEISPLKVAGDVKAGNFYGSNLFLPDDLITEFAAIEIQGGVGQNFLVCYDNENLQRRVFIAGNGNIYLYDTAGMQTLAMDSATGNLTASGNLQGNRLISTVVEGTAPLSVISTTVNPNLNSDLLDGQHGSYYQNADNINAGTLAVARGGTGTSTGSITGTGALTFTAGGTNQNVNLVPSGTGRVSVTGDLNVSGSIKQDGNDRITGNAIIFPTVTDTANIPNSGAAWYYEGPEWGWKLKAKDPDGNLYDLN